MNQVDIALACLPLQIEVDVHAGVSTASYEGLCLEILGNLRRCLTQQADVRLLLYQVHIALGVTTVKFVYKELIWTLKIVPYNRKFLINV